MRGEEKKIEPQTNETEPADRPCFQGKLFLRMSIPPPRRLVGGSKRQSAFRGDNELQAAPPITENLILANDSLDHEAEAQEAIQRIYKV